MNEAFVDAAIAWISSQLEASSGSEDPNLAARVVSSREQFFADFHADVATLALSATELAVLLTLLTVELQPAADQLLRSIEGSRRRAIRRFVYGAGASLVAQQELGASGQLTKLGFMEGARSPGGPDLCISDRVLRYLHGDETSDQIVERCILARLRGSLTLSALLVSPASVEQVQRALRRDGATVLLSGSPGIGRRSLLSAAVRSSGGKTLEIDARRLATDADTFRAQLRAIARECRLTRRIPVIANVDALIDTNLQHLAGELGAAQLLMTCGLHRPTITCDRPTIVIEMGQPTTAQRAALWHASLGQGTLQDAQQLAEQYPLAPALICNAAEAAKARANGRGLEPDDVYAGIRSVLDDRLGQFATRVTVTQTWEDLVLPPEQLDTIVELMARVRGRSKVYEQWGFAAKVGKGLGVSALFSGPPGTGKTMVAALIARDLGLELYQVDMAKIVSKFIGETEKNLGALFDAAEAGHAIVLFDEADALFGKRTDVKSSNDRYANLETNYLLQRLETFTGICLLTSNHESHIDPAFQRRLSLHLRFEVPEVEERALLWRATLPAAAPLAEDIDFAGLAQRYAMSGGYIRNAALRAAFLAADEDTAIRGAHLERAARVEYEGMGKIAA